jgi:hypothetical protein
MFNNESICIILVALLVIIIINNINYFRNEEYFNTYEEQARQNRALILIEQSRVNKDIACDKSASEFSKSITLQNNFNNKNSELNISNNEVIRLRNINDSIKQELTLYKNEYTDAEEKLLAAINKANLLGTNAENADELAKFREEKLAEKIQKASEQAAIQHATEALLVNKISEEIELKKANEIKSENLYKIAIENNINLDYTKNDLSTIKNNQNNFYGRLLKSLDEMNNKYISSENECNILKAEENNILSQITKTRQELTLNINSFTTSENKLLQDISNYEERLIQQNITKENNRKIAEEQTKNWKEVNKLPHFKIVTKPCLDDLDKCWKNWGFSNTPSGLVNDFSIVYNNNKSFELIASIITNNMGFSTILEFKVKWNNNIIKLTNNYSPSITYEIYFFRNKTQTEIYIKNINDIIGLKIGELTNFNINSSDLLFKSGFIERIENVMSTVTPTVREISNLDNPFIILRTARCDSDPRGDYWNMAANNCFQSWGTGELNNPMAYLMYNDNSFYLIANFSNDGRLYRFTIYYDKANRNSGLTGTYKTTESYEIKIIQNTNVTSFFIKNLTLNETNYTQIGIFNNVNIDKSDEKLIFPTKFFTQIIK